EVCTLFEEQFIAKDIRFSLNVPDGNCLATIDPLNFDKVLVNVLSNACRFTPSGGQIKVELSQTANHQSGTQLTLSVADSGQQIDEHEMDRIFDCFYQSDHYRNHHSGAGLGLYLAKQLMVLHGGDIRAENLSGGGCRFVLTFPVSGPKGAAVETDAYRSTNRVDKIPIMADVAIKPTRKSPNKVLIVDEDLDILTYLKAELSGIFQVAAFSEGEAAYKHVLADPPDLIVSDVMMPILDGLSLCDRIRANPNT